MEPLSFLAPILNFLKSFGAWVLSKFNRKVVPLEEYINDEREVGSDYPTKSLRCLEERKSGAKFCWSEEYNPEYQRYFEIDGNTRCSFKHRGQLLWIKRLQR